MEPKPIGADAEIRGHLLTPYGSIDLLLRLRASIVPWTARFPLHPRDSRGLQNRPAGRTGPLWNSLKTMVPGGGLEPPTRGFSDRTSERA